MKPIVIHSDPSKEYFISERCYILEHLNSGAYENLSISRARVEPGVSTQLHALKEADEFYYILSGRGQVEIGGNDFGEVKAGDLVYIPKETSQRIANTGEEDLIFLCICTPRFTPERYINLEMD